MNTEELALQYREMMWHWYQLGHAHGLVCRELGRDVERDFALPWLTEDEAPSPGEAEAYWAGLHDGHAGTEGSPDRMPHQWG